LGRGIKPAPCGRCGQPTRYFWLEEGNELLPWCNFCVTAQVLCYIGPTPARRLVVAFAPAIRSQRAADVHSISTALRALAVRVHKEHAEPNDRND